MVEAERQQPMIEAPVATDAIRRAYDLLSPVYGWCVAPLERKPKLRGLELGDIKPEDRVLEVAVGTGAAMLEILKRVDKTNIVSGVDLSHRMLQKSRRLVAKTGFTNVELYQADARSLPFEDGGGSGRVQAGLERQRSPGPGEHEQRPAHDAVGEALPSHSPQADPVPLRRVPPRLHGGIS